MTATVSTAQLMAAARISQRQVEWWVKAGILKPVCPNPGQGQPRRFHPIEALAARVCACLQPLGGRSGVSTDLLARVADAVRADVRETGWGEIDVELDADAVTLVVPITDPGLGRGP